MTPETPLYKEARRLYYDLMLLWLKVHRTDPSYDRLQRLCEKAFKRAERRY